MNPVYMNAVEASEFFLGFLCNFFGCFITARITFTPVYSLSAVRTCDLWHIHISLSSYNGYKLNSLLTYYQQGFIAQLLEHRIGIAEVMGSNPVFLGFLCNCFSCFITARITFTSVLCSQYIMWSISYTHLTMYSVLLATPPMEYSGNNFDLYFIAISDKHSAYNALLT